MRFTQEDTYRVDGLNLYAYCANNPVYYEDPSGHISDCQNRNFKYINVETETYYKGGKPVVVKYWWQTKNASRVDLHITEKVDSGNPMIKPDRHIIGDIKTGGDSYEQEQMARNQANVVTNASPIGRRGNKLLYPEVNDPNVQHVQFKPVPQGQTTPRFEFGKNPQVGAYNVPGITEKIF